MENKTIIFDGKTSELTLDNVKLSVSGTKHVSPKKGDIYTSLVEDNDLVFSGNNPNFSKKPNGKFLTVFHCWNGVGYATISGGKTEVVTFH